MNMAEFNACVGGLSGPANCQENGCECEDVFHNGNVVLFGRVWGFRIQKDSWRHVPVTQWFFGLNGGPHRACGFQTFHVPPVWSPGFSRSGPPEGGTPNKWRPRGPVHGPEAFGKNERGLSMNLPLSLPSPPHWAGERVAEGRERGIRISSWSQCIRKNERGLSMNRRVLPASCRQRNRSKALPTRRRQHIVGGLHAARTAWTG